MPSVPSELSEQIYVVKRLRVAGVLFCAVPNGGRRDRREAILLKASGTVSGVPDLLIFDSPPGRPECVGVALEMKRQGAKKSSVSKTQRKWLKDLEQRGWLSLVAFGADDALAQLKDVGFEI